MDRDHLKYICGVLLFGFNGIIASPVNMESNLIVFYRTLLGSMLLLGFILLKQRRLPWMGQNKKDVFFVALSGVAMGIGWLFLFQAYRMIGVGTATLIYYTGPVIVVLVSPLVTKERLTRRTLVCLGIVMAGMLLTNLRSLSGGSNLTGLFYGLMTAVFYAVLVLANKQAKTISGMDNAAIQVLFSFLTVAVYTIVRGNLCLPEAATDWTFLLLLGLLNTGTACYLYFSAIGSMPTNHISVMGYIEPLSAVVGSALILNEDMYLLKFFGILLILGGTYIMVGPSRITLPRTLAGKLRSSHRPIVYPEHF